MIIETLAALTIAMVLTANCLKVFREGVSRTQRISGSYNKMVAITKGQIVRCEELPQSVKENLKIKADDSACKVAIGELSNEELNSIGYKTGSCMTTAEGEVTQDKTPDGFLYYLL